MFTWTVFLRGFCVPDKDACDGFVIIEKHVSHAGILRELSSYEKGMCPLLRKGESQEQHSEMFSHGRYVSRVLTDARRKSERIGTFLHPHATLRIRLAPKALDQKRHFGRPFVMERVIKPTEMAFRSCGKNKEGEARERVPNGEERGGNGRRQK